MYVYKKNDKNKEHPINLSDGVQFKTLWNKALKIEAELRELAFGNPGSSNLMFNGEDHLTKSEIYKAIDHVKSFRHNLKLKPNMEVE